MKHWRYIEEDQVAAGYGLAADEFLMNGYIHDQLHEATLRLYTYKNYSALVGRFQNIHAELDLGSICEDEYEYSRRLTGGGAIIMGQDQLGVCLATSKTFSSPNTRELYQLFSRPVINALKELGIDAVFKGKNDLEVGGKKIAGLGIHANAYGALHFHTSLLVDLDIEVMLRVLNIPMQKIGDKANIHKVEQRITTISRELGRKVLVDEVRSLIRKHYALVFGIEFQTNGFTGEERKEIESLADEKYRNDEWIFQNSPEPDMTGMGLKKTNEGLLRSYVALKGENIKSVLITGDFAEHDQLFRDIEVRLKWTAIDRKNMEKIIDQAFSSYQNPVQLTSDDVFDTIWRAAMRAMKEMQYTYEGSCYDPGKVLVHMG